MYATLKIWESERRQQTLLQYQASLFVTVDQKSVSLFSNPNTDDYQSKSHLKKAMGAWCYHACKSGLNDSGKTSIVSVISVNGGGLLHLITAFLQLLVFQLA